VKTLARLSPRTGHLHVLPVDCRPRGFSPPRRFGLQLRSGILAPQPDRIHIVSSSLKALSDLRSTPSTGDSVAGPPRDTSILPVPLGTTPLAVGSMYLTSSRHNLRRGRPAGPMDAAPSSRSRSCGVDAWGCAMSLSPMCVHPTKNATPSQHRCITASQYPLAVSYRRIASLA
jgi:hypothetical protein